MRSSEKALFVLTVLVVLILFSSLQAQSTTVDLSNAMVQVCFSPGGGCTEAIAKEISLAKEEILVQAYSFTSATIAKALVDAHKRGVHVEVILDKSQRSHNYSSADFMNNADIPSYIDSVHAIAHNKIMVIDKRVVITGSFNFTKAAEDKNAENLLIIRSRSLAKLYLDNWKMHKEHSQEYEGKSQ